MGRLDFQVKVRGFRIEPGEIEAQLASVPGVSRAVVAAREVRPGDVRLVAYLLCERAMPAEADLRSHLRRTLPEYMVPQHFVQLEAFPLQPNGKLDRRALPLPLQSPEPSAAATAQAALTPTEESIAGVWREVLGVAHVRPSDNFFDLGGHSLLAMRAIALIEKRAGRRIAPRQFGFETLAQMACSADEESAGPEAGAPAAKPSPGLLGRLIGRLGAR
jgi:acyl carrier protein